MKTVFSLFLSLLFLAVSVAVAGPVCVSMTLGRSACCEGCPLRMTVGGSPCCRQGLEKGTVGLLQQPVKKPVSAMTTSLVKGEWVVFHRSSISLAFLKEPSIYLTEERLLL